MKAVACLLGLGLLLSLLSAANGHNITKILSDFPEYSSFNSRLSQSKLADEINSRTTITVLVVDNAAMAALTDKKLGLAGEKNVLSLHVLLDYFDPAKLHDIANGTTLTTTLYQTTGNAEGNSGFLNITDLKGGKVGFGPAAPGSKLAATYVKSVKEIPYNISVIQISQLIIPSDLPAPAPSANELNISAVLTKAGCKTFLQLITATGVLKTYEDAVTGGGLTLFAPTDAAFSGTVGGRLKKLPTAQQVSVLEYHALPVYSPLGTLKTTDGALSTLATNGKSKFALRVSSSGDTVALNTGVVKSTISGTAVDDQPVAVFTVDKLLEPPEVFAAVPAPSPAPVTAPSSSPSPAAAPTPGTAAPSPATTPATSPSPSSALSPPAPLTAGPAASPEASSPAAGSSEKGFAASLNRAGCGSLVLLFAACSVLLL